MNLVDALLQGDRLALARILTQIENDTPESRAALDVLYQNSGKAHVIGITGPTGSGKSTLVNLLAKAFRKPEGDRPSMKVAILAVDPTSPFTGGAVLGDRVRMRDLSGDPGFFIRSVATRGKLGGLSYTTAEMVTALDAAGYEIIFVETVGAGQSEVDIVRLAQTVLLVENPGMGDDIQAIKAGILEIADILVINKADRPGVEQTERALRNMLELNPAGKNNGDGLHHLMDQGFITSPITNDTNDAWQVPILRSVAAKEEGVDEIVMSLRHHLEYLQSSGLLKINQNIHLRENLENLVRDYLYRNWFSQLNPVKYENALEKLFNREISPIHLAEKIIRLEF
jgi:LAO/AO transport system kinase